ncbi:hypothetical protein BEWA_018180 [Theileria equi strain WA]|uniref:WW domain-containing protein n=1 Tax=Theileria equi strain WA TaxID=1537102 RepID=L0ATV5_THEEQ|nr:hypothetical protein BEWA_018180 [Theileria equi strain WA]AFZ78975.1 hypothetical protein BEWA_018180 [Theileria equi strain WA]|eukprot:XP_004828641.1 hypothetical protein BEWA_018180 [Theileria equi strain WA]
MCLSSTADENVKLTKIWKEVIDPLTRSIYFWNVETGETTWKIPDETIPGSHLKQNTGSLGICTNDSQSKVSKRRNRVDQFFGEINFICRTCDSYPENETPSIHEIEELIQNSLGSVETILNLSTPNTKTRNKFDSVKHTLIEYHNILKKYGCLDVRFVEEIVKNKEEIERTVENIKGLYTGSCDIVNDYQVYVKKEKQNIHKKKWLDFAKTKLKGNGSLQFLGNLRTDTNPNVVKKTKENKNQLKKNYRIKAIHERWNKATGAIDEMIPPRTSTPIHNPRDEERNPNLVPITTPWWEHISENNP